MTSKNTADIGFEREIWKAADKMRGNIDLGHEQLSGSMHTNEDVIEEMLKTTREIINGEKVCESMHLMTKELAFYDVLIKPVAVNDFYRNDQLLAITHGCSA